jgi:3-dehydroquinate synthase
MFYTQLTCKVHLLIKKADSPMPFPLPFLSHAHASAITHVPVALGNRSYDILIGAGIAHTTLASLTTLGEGLRVAVVTDTNIAPLHAQPFVDRLQEAGFQVSLIIVEAGEASKAWSTLGTICDEILATKIERGDLLIALGGGVIGDLVGFAASIVRRGIRFVQVPTSLLAQVDSSVGGKTGVNSAHGKNLIGTFYQPSLVMVDTSYLDTLPEREFRAGYAEVIKYGLINNLDFFDWCESHWREIFSGEGGAREHAIATSCRAKAAVVAKDEHEKGDRALLNLGHTFGHALERMTGYDTSRLVHGEGVSIGMAMAFRFSAERELCVWDDAIRVSDHLCQVGLPTTLQDISGEPCSVDALLDAMLQDKKVVRGELTFILANGIGQSFIAKGIPMSDVRSFLEQELQQG